MRFVTITLIVVTLLLPIPAGASEEHAPTREFLVNAPLARLADLSALSGGHHEGVGFDWYLIERHDPGNVDDIAFRLSAEHHLTVVPNHVIAVLDGSTEPLFSDQWSLENIGQDGGTSGADIAARDAWVLSEGQGVVVAVLDSGVDLTHPDLAASIWVNPGEIAANGIDDDGNGFIDDVNGWDFVPPFPGDADPSDESGHGTFVAGLIGAPVNGIGIAGIAPKVAVMPVRVCTGTCLVGDLIEGISYALANGTDIINASLGGFGYNAAVRDAIAAAESAGVVFVASAGNDGTNNDVIPLYPASYTLDNILAVTSTDRDDLADLSTNYGPTSVDLGAPGVDVVSLSLGGYATGSGTSFASAHATAAAAIMLGVRPSLQPADLIDRMLDGSPGLASLAERTVSGGRLDAYRSAGIARFTDIRTSTFFDDIIWAAVEGVTKGCDPPNNDHFCPGEFITRGQMAAFITRALNLPATAHDYFLDDDGTTFEDDINRLAEARITRGCNPPANDGFCPADKLTRGQMAAFIDRGWNLAATATDFFVDDDGTTFESEINRLAAAGITAGCNPPANDRYCPGNDLTRGQMAAFIHRAET